MIAALIVGALTSGVAVVFWSLGAGVARRAALEEAAGALRGEAARRALEGESREAFALRFGAFLVRELDDGPAAARCRPS